MTIVHSCTTLAYGPFACTSGHISGPHYIDATTSDGSEKYYFKFTDNGVDYISDAVTLAQLASGTTVVCKVQKKTYTIPARALNFGNVNGGTGYVRFNSGTNTDGQISFAITSQGNDGVKVMNRNAIEITCLPGTIVYFYVNNSAKGGQPIETYINGYTF